MQDLAYLSAVEALHLFRSRQLSPLELMRVTPVPWEVGMATVHSASPAALKA